MPDTFDCPKCGLPNPATAQFCTSCHAILIHRCPNCWHEQRTGITCEKCGTNFALYAELAVERSMEEDHRLEMAQTAAAAGTLLQIVLLPFTGVAGVLRSVIARVITTRPFNR